jgi:hypothetical protein
MHVKIISREKMRRFVIDRRLLNSKHIFVLIVLSLYLIVFTTFRAPFNIDFPSLHDQSR